MRVIFLLLRESRIDHVLDAGNCDRRFGNVGREDDLAKLGRSRDERFRLVGGGEFGVQRADQDLGGRTSVREQERTSNGTHPITLRVIQGEALEVRLDG